MRANQAAFGQEKKPYIKPQLLTHGSVQKLTENTRRDRSAPDCGSHVRFPVFDGKIEHGGSCDW